MDLENKVKRLPDYYDKSENTSNNWKILEIAHLDKQDLKDCLDGIRESSDLLLATGAALDVWGSIYGEARNGDSDAVFLIRIRVAQLKDKVQVDYSSWYRTILEIFGCQPDELEIVGTGNPFEYRFVRFPYGRCNEIGITVGQAETLIMNSLPITGNFETLQVNHWSNIKNYTWVYVSAYTWNDVLHNSAFRT